MPAAGRKKTPVCIFWDSDALLYRIYLAEYVRGLGWLDDTYLGSARDLRDLREILLRFNYKPVCGVEV